MILQGDVVALYCEGGSYIGGYTYDAWGNATVVYADGISTTDTAMLRIYNPFRYRGYYYDTETGLYYLQSRYYNPEWGRFISPDQWDVIQATPTELTDKNLFAYCDNNPITRIDDDGEFWNVIIGAVVGAAVGAICTWIDGGSLSEILVSAACGAVSGGLAATGLGGLAGQMAIGAVTSMIDSGYKNYNDYSSGEKTLGEALAGTLVDTALGATFGAMGYEGTGAFKGSNSMRKNAHAALARVSPKTFHPTVRAASKKVFKESRRYLWKTTKQAFSDSILTAATGMGVAKMAEFYY